MMKQNKMQNERINQRKLVNPTKKEWRWHMAQFGVGCLLLFFAVNVPVFAAGNVDTSQITGGFDAIYQVIAAIVSAIGSIFLLWGLFEWAQSLNTQAVSYTHLHSLPNQWGNLIWGGCTSFGGCVLRIPAGYDRDGGHGKYGHSKDRSGTADLSWNQ